MHRQPPRALPQTASRLSRRQRCLGPRTQRADFDRTWTIHDQASRQSFDKLLEFTRERFGRNRGEHVECGSVAVDEPAKIESLVGARDGKTFRIEHDQLQEGKRRDIRLAAGLF